ncbi:MAG: type II toxin-antitoxin system VapC family toxin [Planctomycetaceae bacterium]
MSRIYIETTIPSFYYEVRSDAMNVARREWTRQWFDKAITTQDVVTSAAVLQELQRGNFPGKSDAIAMVTSLDALAITDEVLQVVDEYINRKLMPLDPAGDALHLAVASHHGCDFLVTWNCRHLANANKFGQIHRINDMLGLPTPILTTPLELLGGNDHDQ